MYDLAFVCLFEDGGPDGVGLWVVWARLESLLREVEFEVRSVLGERPDAVLGLDDALQVAGEELDSAERDAEFGGSDGDGELARVHAGCAVPGGQVDEELERLGRLGPGVAAADAAERLRARFRRVFGVLGLGLVAHEAIRLLFGQAEVTQQRLVVGEGVLGLVGVGVLPRRPACPFGHPFLSHLWQSRFRYQIDTVF